MHLYEIYFILLHFGYLYIYIYIYYFRSLGRCSCNICLSVTVSKFICGHNGSQGALSDLIRGNFLVRGCLNSVYFFCNQVFPLRRINWPFHLWLLLVLLPCTIRYVRFHANIVLLWVHGLHLLWFLSHAWGCRFPCIFILCSSHIPIYQMRVASHSVSLKFNRWSVFSFSGLISGY